MRIRQRDKATYCVLPWNVKHSAGCLLLVGARGGQSRLYVMPITPQPICLYHQPARNPTTHTIALVGKVKMHRLPGREGKGTYELVHGQNHGFGFQISWEHREQVLRGLVGSP